jgi:hypothetical protein
MLEFPGQLGSNGRLNCPEGTGRMAAVDEAMSRCLALMPEDKQRLALFNLLSSNQALPMLDARIEFCNTRREHKIEGWRKCGYYRPAFRLADNMDWMPATMIDRLTADQQQQLRVMLSANPNLTGEIAMSPREVFEAGRGKLKKLTPAQTALLLARTEGREENVRRGRIEIECPEVDDEPLRFGPAWRDGMGRQEPFRPDDKYLVRVNPFDPRAAFLYDAKGGFIGTTPIIHGGFRDDAENSEAQYKANAQVIGQWNARARQLAAPITRRAARIARNNAGLMAGVEAAKNNLADAAEAALQRAGE